MKKLYHISLDLEGSLSTTFSPWIPEKSSRMDDEDSKTKRICLSDSLEGCISAVPFGGNSIDEYINYFEETCPIRVYEFDKADIKGGNLITSEELYKTNKVPDANLTHEVWVTHQKLKPIKTYLIVITGYNEEYPDLISYEDSKKLEDGNFDASEILDNCSFVTILKDLEYRVINKARYDSYFEISTEDSITNKQFKYIKELLNNITYKDVSLENAVLNESRNTILAEFNSYLNVDIDLIIEKCATEGIKVKYIL